MLQKYHTKRRSYRRLNRRMLLRLRRPWHPILATKLSGISRCWHGKCHEGNCELHDPPNVPHCCGINDLRESLIALFPFFNFTRVLLYGRKVLIVNR
jgi:hypothetical protein